MMLVGVIRLMGVCGVWAMRVDGLGWRGRGGRTDGIEINVDGDEGLGLKKETDHCTVDHHCIA